MTALLTDDCGEMELVWFQGINGRKKNISWCRICSFWQTELFQHHYNIAHPELETISRECFGYN